MSLIDNVQQLFLPIFKLFYGVSISIFLIAIIAAIVILIRETKEYNKGTYCKITKHPYFSVKYDKGRYGEYLIYNYLKRFEDNGAKFLFNVYIPKENGETTEIDVLMICSKGVFVFESKNYSGWIFGSENQKQWYQTLPKGRGRSHKEHFYNPIMQNKSHIKHLKVFIGDEVPMRSIIVFSERCILKSVQVYSNDICVIKRCDVSSIVCGIYNQIPEDLLSDEDILNIYNKLYPCTQVDSITREKHIETVNNVENFVSKEQVVENNTDLPNLKCPICCGNLVLRTANRGVNAGKQFYGCSNYPKCKHIKSIE